MPDGRGLDYAALLLCRREPSHKPKLPGVTKLTEAISSIPDVNRMTTPSQSTKLSPFAAGRLEDLDRSALSFAEAKAAIGEAPGSLLVEFRPRRNMMRRWNPWQP